MADLIVKIDFIYTILLGALLDIQETLEYKNYNHNRCLLNTDHKRSTQTSGHNIFCKK